MQAYDVLMCPLTDLGLEAEDVGSNLLGLCIVDRFDHRVLPEVVQHLLHVPVVHGAPCT